jgi:hypothetical protein
MYVENYAFVHENVCVVFDIENTFRKTLSHFIVYSSIEYYFKVIPNVFLSEKDHQMSVTYYFISRPQ